MSKCSEQEGANSLCIRRGKNIEAQQGSLSGLQSGSRLSPDLVYPAPELGGKTPEETLSSFFTQTETSAGERSGGACSEGRLGESHQDSEVQGRLGAGGSLAICPAPACGTREMGIQTGGTPSGRGPPDSRRPLFNS